MTIDQASGTLHLPPALLEKLQAYQFEQGFATASEAAIAILTQFFETSSSPVVYAPLDRVEKLEQHVKELTDQLMSLSQLLVKPAPVRPTPAAQNGYVYPKQALTYEDIEDEPDEILWEFLPHDYET